MQDHDSGVDHVSF